jgi:hypothetical protein
MIRAAFRNASPLIIRLIVAEIDNLGVSGNERANEVYQESLHELKSSIKQVYGECIDVRSPARL